MEALPVCDGDPNCSGAYHPWVYDKVGLNDSADVGARAEGKRVVVSKCVVSVEAVLDEGGFWSTMDGVIHGAWRKSPFASIGVASSSSGR